MKIEAQRWPNKGTVRAWLSMPKKTSGPLDEIFLGKRQPKLDGIYLLYRKLKDLFKG